MLIRPQFLRLILPALVLFIFFSILINNADAVTLVWDPNQEEDLAGYKIHYGLATGDYSHTINVGNVTEYELLGLVDGTIYYLAATAYNFDLNESAYSDKLFYTAKDSDKAVYIGATDLIVSQVEYTESTVIYSQDFSDFDVGSDPDGWIDTQALNSMVEDDSLFKIFDIGGNRVFGTISEHTNVHSHMVNAFLGDNEYSGRMMIASASGAIGVTFLSQYTDEDRYYRLRRWGSNDFHIAPHGTATMGDINSDVVPIANTWYNFKIFISDTGLRTEIKAKLWAESDTEPFDWQIDAYDDSVTRLTEGKFGAWGMSPGAKYWDDFKVIIK